MSLCSGAEAGQDDIYTLTSGRVTTTLLTWSQDTPCMDGNKIKASTMVDDGIKASTVVNDGIKDIQPEALDALNANDGVIKASTLEDGMVKDTLDALDDGMIKVAVPETVADDGVIKAVALDVLDTLGALDAPGSSTTATTLIGVSMYSDYSVCT